MEGRNEACDVLLLESGYPECSVEGKWVWPAVSRPVLVVLALLVVC